MKHLLLIPLVLFLSCEDKKEKIYGCTDIDANNFNPHATIFDNSCEYNPECTGSVNWDYTHGYHNNGIQDFYLIEITGNITNTGDSIIERTIIRFRFYAYGTSYTDNIDVHYDLEPYQNHNFYDQFSFTTANNSVVLDTVIFRCD